jgi:hypothetical protein
MKNVVREFKTLNIVFLLMQKNRAAVKLGR